MTFRYRAPHGDPAVARVGLIAEEVARIFPRAVGLDGEGRPRSIHYGLLAGLAVEAVGTRIGSALETGAARLAGALWEAIPNP